jgi:hypothetical protein
MNPTAPANQRPKRPLVAQPPRSRTQIEAARNAARYRRLIPDLRPGEQVVMLKRRHPAVLVRRLAPPLVLIAALLAGLFFAGPLLNTLRPDPFTTPPEGVQAWLPSLLWFVWLAVLALLLVRIAFVLFDWADDWLALTTRRLIIMDKTLFIRETRREAPIMKVQNVVAEYPNALGLALDVGDLKVDTAGIGLLEYKGLSSPRVVREAIFAQQAALSANEPPPEDRRKAAIVNIMQGVDPSSSTRPTPPKGIAVPSPLSAASGYGLFNVLFPFSPQRTPESVTWHKHWALLLRGLLLPALLYLVTFAAWFVSFSMLEPGPTGLLATILGWAAVLLMPVCLVWALWNWEDWRNDLYKLDHERVYHIESLPFGLREQSTETLVTRITDATYVVPGPLANLLNYGDVILKTPGESTDFAFKAIPCPREVQREIMDRVDLYRLKESSSTDREIEAWLKAYHDVQSGQQTSEGSR